MDGQNHGLSSKVDGLFKMNGTVLKFKTAQYFNLKYEYFYIKCLSSNFHPLKC